MASRDHRWGVRGESGITPRLIVGLGNPGSSYERTRHNIGFEVVKALAEEFKVAVTKKGFSSFWGKGEVEKVPVLFLLPQTYMNRSGAAVREAKDYFRLEDKDLIAVHDELDFPLGRVKLDFDAGAAGHRGIASLIEDLGTKAFHRVRVGIGRPERKEDVERFVLSPFEDKDFGVVQEMIQESQTILKQWILKESV